MPSKKDGEIPIDDLDIEDDFIYFCFAKFTKTMIAIDKLIKAKLYEDALILVRSNYENYIYAKAVVFSSDMIDNFVEFKLGLVGNKKYKIEKGKNLNKYDKTIVNIKSNVEHKYIDNIYDIAKNANEVNSYNYLYKFLCEITHCNFITSGNYRDGVVYSYKMENDITLYNTLFWSVYLNFKFYNTLIEGEMFDIDELEDIVSASLIEDHIKIIEFFEVEIKNIEASIRSIESNSVKVSELKKDIRTLHILKKELLDFLKE